MSDTRIGDVIEVTHVAHPSDPRTPAVGSRWQVSAVPPAGILRGAYACLDGCAVALGSSLGDRWTVVEEAAPVMAGAT